MPGGAKPCCFVLQCSGICSCAAESTVRKCFAFGKGCQDSAGSVVGFISALFYLKAGSGLGWRTSKIAKSQCTWGQISVLWKLLICKNKGWVKNICRPSMYWCKGLFFPRCRTLRFLLNFTRFLPALFSSLSRSLWVAAWSSGLSAIPPSCAVCMNTINEMLLTNWREWCKS